jgi:hypothetical protein
MTLWGIYLVLVRMAYLHEKQTGLALLLNFARA